MPIIGLDLGRHSFRAVEIEREKDKYVLLKYGTYENPKINIDSTTKQDISDYSASVKQFFAETGFSTNVVVVALPEYQIFMRVIKVPQMSDKDLKNSIQFEAEQYIPFPLKEMSLSYQKLDVDAVDRTKVNVQLVAAKRTVLDKYIQILRNVHLIPKALEPETLSIARVLGEAEDRPSANLILNIGFSSTIIIITYKGFVRFTRNIAVGGDALTRAVQQGLSLDYLQAEEYKKTYGLDNNQADGKIFEILKPFFDNVIVEIKKSKIFFTSQNQNVNINRVVLSGGTAQMTGLLYYMANNLDLEVEIANPWKNILLSPKIESKKDALIEQGPIFSTCVGLAIKEI